MHAAAIVSQASSSLLGKRELHLGRDCSNESIQRPSILVVVDVAVPNCLPHMPHLEPYSHHRGPLDIVGLAEGRPPTVGANFSDNSLDPVVTMAPVRGGRAAPPVKVAISVDLAAAAGSAAAARVHARLGCHHRERGRCARACQERCHVVHARLDCRHRARGVRGCSLRHPPSRRFPRQLEFHVGAAVSRGRAADATTT
jgi:hypothetical protein